MTSHNTVGQTCSRNVSRKFVKVPDLLVYCWQSQISKTLSRNQKKKITIRLTSCCCWSARAHIHTHTHTHIYIERERENWYCVKN